MCNTYFPGMQGKDRGAMTSSVRSIIFPRHITRKKEFGALLKHIHLAMYGNPIFLGPLKCQIYGAYRNTWTVVNAEVRKDGVLLLSSSYHISEREAALDFLVGHIMEFFKEESHV